MTRLFFDTEFIDTGAQIHLLSIGVVREDGATFYAEPSDTPYGEASLWVEQNVLVHMERFKHGPRDESIVIPRAQIAADLIEFAGPSPEWWAYMADYDWVVLSQTYGSLVDRPAGWPFWCHDVMQLAEVVGVDPQDVPQGVEHHALADALWTKQVWDLCQTVTS